jgi:hypothetical protein
MTTVSLDALPTDPETMHALQISPEGAVVGIVFALWEFAIDQESGKIWLSAAVHPDLLGTDPLNPLPPHTINLMRSQIGGKPEHLRSYFRGAIPENGYKIPEPPFEFEVTANPYSGDRQSGKMKLFITSSGAASPRPVQVQKDDHGYWRATEWSSLLLGVMPGKG